MTESTVDLDESSEKRAKHLHEEAVIIDGLIPTTVYLEDPDYRNNLSEGGVTAANFTVSIKKEFQPTTDHIQDVWSKVQKDETKTVIRNSDDIRSAKEENKTGVVIGFQNGLPIQLNLDYVRAFHQMGVRVVQLTYNSQNNIGSGCWEENDPGLSHFGRDVVDEMNELGILVDLSHCGDTTTMEAIEYSDDPVAFTHIGVRSIGHSQGRGKTDEQMKAVAEDGGVIGITFFPSLIKMDPETYDVLNSTVDDVLDHIDHVVDLVGVDHVGFGTDLNDKNRDLGDSQATTGLDDRHLKLQQYHAEIFGNESPHEYEYPAGLDRHTKLLNLTRGLVSRGYTDEEVKKILGGNFLRLFEEVWDES
jgi:membrane dipeptidase